MYTRRISENRQFLISINSTLQISYFDFVLGIFRRVNQLYKIAV